MKNSGSRIHPSHRITSIEQLESVYGEPVPRSLAKEISYISDHYRAFIEKAPFVTVATAGPEGLDCSPRGDPAGFVRVVDEKTLMIPDRRGNNRMDSMRNLVRDPRISLLFLIPGINETLRINGRAAIVVDPDLCEADGNPADGCTYDTVSGALVIGTTGGLSIPAAGTATITYQVTIL